MADLIKEQPQKPAWAAVESDRQEQGEMDNTPEAVEAWAMELHQRFGGRPIAVCLEPSRGSLVCLLAKYPHWVVVSSTSEDGRPIPGDILPVWRQKRSQRYSLSAGSPPAAPGKTTSTAARYGGDASAANAGRDTAADRD